MKALIWKELRENIWWALLAMLALGGAEFSALYHEDYFDLSDGVTLCRSPFLTVTLFGCAVVGTALGLIQVLPELKRDRWAALLHRPASRGHFYWSKAIAGMLLYLMATGLPLLAVVWRVATPGNFAAPFLPMMIQPSLADLIEGLAYYFAALVLALHQGRFLLRVLPLFAALHVSFVAVDQNLFRVVIEASLVMILALGVAGWGAIHARESLLHRPWIGRLAFLAVAFYGLCGIGNLVGGIGGIAGHMDQQRFHVWELLRDGTPAHLEYVDGLLISTTDVAGQPFTDPRYRPENIRGHTLGMNIASANIRKGDDWRWADYQSSYRESDTYLYALQTNSESEHWFHIFDQGGYFVGVRTDQKKVFSQLGADGFVAPGAFVRRFPESTRNDAIGGDRLILASRDFLRCARLAKQEIVPLDLPAPSPIYGMSHAWVTVGEQSISFFGVALGTGLAVYDDRARLVAMLPYHQDVERWGRVSMGVASDMKSFILYYEPSMWLKEEVRQSMPSYVQRVNAQGEILAAFTLPPLPDSVRGQSRYGFIAERLRTPAFFFGEMLYRRIGAALGSNRLQELLDEQLRRDSTWQAGRIVVLLALALAVTTFFWARRAQLAPQQAWTWTGVVCALSLPGFLLFWLVERPRVVRCAACTRSRRIDQEKCAHCGAPWPEYSPDGTEIIDRTPPGAGPVEGPAPSTLAPLGT